MPIPRNRLLSHLRRANEVALRVKALGRHPFGCLLVAPDGVTVLAEQGNIDTVRHAESTLAQMASLNYSREFLWECTLVTTFEPCAMCTGTIYWANIGHIVYGASERDLLVLTGNAEENPTLDLPCRVVFAAGQRKVDVIGPLLEAEAAALQSDFWRDHGMD